MIKTRIFIKSANLKLLSLYILYLTTILKKLSIKYSVRFNPTTQKKLTLLKSPHVYKKHKEQFSIKTHSALFSLSIPNLNQWQLSLFLQNKPKFVDLSLFLER
jgi:small subunit ribosomal protein S10